MESSGSSANSSDPPSHRWAKIIGTAIAILTLTVPTAIIAYYSSSTRDSLLQTPYSSRPIRTVRN